MKEETVFLLVCLKVLLRHIRDRAITVSLNHGQGAAQKVAETIGQVTVYPSCQGLLGKVAILSERHFPQQKVSKGIRPKAIHHPIRVNDIAAAF